MLNSLNGVNSLTESLLAAVPPWVWIMGAVAAVGVIVLTVLLLVNKKKKSAPQKTETATETTPQPDEATPPEEEPQAERIKEPEPAEAVAEEPVEEPDEVAKEVPAEEPEEVVEEEPAEEPEEVAEEEPIEETEEVEAVVEEEEVDEEDEPDAPETEEATEINESSVTVQDGFGIVIRYNKSFTAKLIQSSDEVKDRYTVLKNELLSYKKTKSRVSWRFDSFNAGRAKIAKFNIRGKTLKLYLALNPDDYADSKYKVERSKAKTYAEVPCLYKITNPRRLKYAAELIAEAAKQHGLTPIEKPNENYYLPYETTEALIEKKLIKELVTKTAYDEYMRRKSQAEVAKVRREVVSAKEVNAIISDDVAVSLVEDVRKKEQQKSTPVAPAPQAENTPTAAPAAAPVAMPAPATASAYTGKKGIINVDTLSAHFEAKDKVTLEALKAKGLIAKNIGYVKVLARGTLNKPLEVILQDYSIEAVKMIVLTGGKVKKV